MNKVKVNFQKYQEAQMNKETLIKIKEEIIDLLYKAEIDKFDKTELMINLTKILDNYDECIDVLQRELKR